MRTEVKVKEKAEGQYGGLDYFRLAAAFLVVAIHTSPFASFSEEADFLFTRVIARTAVPFFFMVTGFFLFPRYLFLHSMDNRPVSKILKRDFILYITAVMLYLPVNLYAGQLRGLSLGGLFRMFLVDGTFYHLWYLPAAISGIFLVWISGRKMPFQVLLGISLCLYLFGLFGDSYYGFSARIPFWKAVYSGLFSVSSYTRNGLFYAPVFLVMGAEASRKTPVMAAQEKRVGKETGNRRGGRGCLIYGTGFACSLVLMAAEGAALHKGQIQRHDSMYIMLLPTMFFLFRLLLSVEVEPVKKWRTLSTEIYLFHPLCIILVRGGAKAVHLESLFLDNSLLHYLAVCALSLACALGLTHAAGRRRDCGFRVPGGQAKPGGIRGGSVEGDPKGRAWIALSRENLAENVETLKRLAAGRELMPAVKANAYGHGAALIAGQLQEMGIRAFCVACVSEGVALRKNGITGDILILGYTHPKDFFLLRKYRLIQTVVDYGYGRQLDQYRKGMRVHVKIDTGMHRLGERAENPEEIVSIFRLKNLRIEGLYTHLCRDETRDPEEYAFTVEQGKRFWNVAALLGERGYSGFSCHLLASYGLFHYPELGGDFVRTGIALYGMFGREEHEEEMDVRLFPVLSLRARIAAVKEVYPGECVGYGGAFIATRKKRIAVLAIGYADGLPRELSCGAGRVLIHGQSAPVVGNICMDQTIVDIDEIPGVKAGETATLIGKSGKEEITAYEWAQKAGTITNEILSRLGERLWRVWE